MAHPDLHRARGFRACHYNGESGSIWHRVPVSRRAAVLVLLFVGRLGELRVVLTKRSSQLRNFPGHISLPGGKADTASESPWMVARREASEEIGLSACDADLRRHAVAVDAVAELPCYLSRTFSAVAPCVAFMAAPPEGAHASGLAHALGLRVNPGESSSIFSCPLRDFLYPAAEAPAAEALDRTHCAVSWGGIPWHLRSYTFPQRNANEVHWLEGFDDVSASESDSGASEGDGEPGRASRAPRRTAAAWGPSGARRHSVTNEKIYDVWGLTANMLHDLAEIVYLGAQPGKQYGEEELIWSIWNHGGQMRQKERSPAEAALISSSPGDPASFGDLLPRTEFNRLKRIYKI